MRLVSQNAWHLFMVGAELASCASHTELRLVHHGCGRSLSVVGNGRSRELCEALELLVAQ